MWLIVTLSVLGAVLLFCLIFSFIAYRLVFYVPKNHKEDVYDIPKGEQYVKDRDKMIALIKETDELPYERVYTTAVDGIKLSAKYYHVKDDAPLQIIFSGYKGSSVRDCCGGQKLARQAGLNTLMVDMRAHGMSGGRTITFGIRERYDCISWINYAIKRFGENVVIYLSGVSMGAATVLMATKLGMPKNVRGITADCPFATPSAVIKAVCKDMGFPPEFIYPFIYVGALIFGRFNLNAASASEAVKHTDIPILLIHGEDDRIVPCEMSKEIYDNCGGYAERHTFPNAAHAISYIEDPDRYEQIVASFLNSISK